MTNWQTSYQEISKLTGWNLIQQPLDAYASWYFDCINWTFLNLWYLPHRIPSLHNDVDKWVSQFTLNGIKSGNICRPS